MLSKKSVKIWLVSGLIGFAALAGSVVIYKTTSTSRMGGSGDCNSNYSNACVPNVEHDIDCRAIRHRVHVVGKDVYHLDADRDGIGCEYY